MVYPRSTEIISRPSLTVTGGWVPTAGDAFSGTFTTAFVGGADGSGAGTVRIQWGDGQITTLTLPTLSATHTYARARKYKIRVTVYDSGAGIYPRQAKSAVIPVTVYPMTMTGQIVTAVTSTMPSVNLPGVVVTLQAWANSLNNWKTMKRAVTKADAKLYVLERRSYECIVDTCDERIRQIEGL